jgi:hypothetical protein
MFLRPWSSRASSRHGDERPLRAESCRQFNGGFGARCGHSGLGSNWQSPPGAVLRGRSCWPRSSHSLPITAKTCSSSAPGRRGHRPAARLRGFPRSPGRPDAPRTPAQQAGPQAETGRPRKSSIKASVTTA